MKIGNANVENNTIQSIPDPLPRQDVAEVPQPPKENLRILCCAISQNSEFVAFADDHKQVTGRSLSDQHILLHFVAFFHVASLFSTGVDNKKEGVDNEIFFA